MRRRTSAKCCRSPLIRYHGDFDWPGVAIAGRMLAAGAAHRAPGLGCGAATPTQGCPATQRPRRSVHHPQRHLALPHRRPGPAVAYPPARRLCRPRRSPGCLTPLVPPNVATEIDEVYDAEAAMNQLGHTSKAVTERHYINRRLVVPDYRAATDRLAPQAVPTGRVRRHKPSPRTQSEPTVSLKARSRDSRPRAQITSAQVRADLRQRCDALDMVRHREQVQRPQ
ncbi:DUF2399 domain-containing protein [Nocardioides sp. HB32]